ncbi:MAG TPA: hypothetical protein VMU69_04310 [Bradyrhizobium sp.]|nr:hypothetical protein [Bradyrhizobium sp.]
MINSDENAGTSTSVRDEQIEQIVAAGPHGAIALAGIATVLVVAIWLAFYFFVFLPRGALL